AERIQQLFLRSPAVHARRVRELADRVGRIPGPAECFKDLGDAARDLADSVREAVEEALCEAPLAGPEAAFEQEVLLATEKILEWAEQNMEGTIAEVVRLYDGKSLEPDTDHLPQAGRNDPA